MEHINIIFVKAYDQYAVEAFKLNAIHYILKPPAKGEIEQAIERVIRQGKRTIKIKAEKVYVNMLQKYAM